jgi:hypothetical protein
MRQSECEPSSMHSQMDKQQARVDADRGLSIRSPFPSLRHWSVTVTVLRGYLKSVGSKCSAKRIRPGRSQPKSVPIITCCTHHECDRPRWYGLSPYTFGLSHMKPVARTEKGQQDCWVGPGYSPVRVSGTLFCC